VPCISLMRRSSCAGPGCILIIGRRAPAGDQPCEDKGGTRCTYWWPCSSTAPLPLARPGVQLPHAGLARRRGDRALPAVQGPVVGADGPRGVVAQRLRPRGYVCDACLLRTSVSPGPDAFLLRLPLLQRLHWRPASPATDTAHAQEEREGQGQQQRFHGHLHSHQMATTIAITATIQSHCQRGGGSGGRVRLGSGVRPLMGHPALCTTGRQRGDPRAPLAG
jgi:hypothetical protein